MLSRLAESYYWIGRYVERAEATSRLLAEHYHLTVEDRSVADDEAAADLADAASPARLLRWRARAAEMLACASYENYIDSIGGR